MSRGFEEYCDVGPLAAGDCKRASNAEADRAMAWLKQAVSAGYKDAERHSRLANQPGEYKARRHRRANRAFARVTDCLTGTAHPGRVAREGADVELTPVRQHVRWGTDLARFEGRGLDRHETAVSS